MADAAARREARRKRILENSENRLQRITGSNFTAREEKTNNCFTQSPNSGPDDVILPDTTAPIPDPTIQQINHIFDKTTYLQEEEEKEGGDDILINTLTNKDFRNRNNTQGTSIDDNINLTHHYGVRNERFSLPNERQPDIINTDTNESEQDVNPHDSFQRVSTQQSYSSLRQSFASKWMLVILAAFINVLYFLQLQQFYGETILVPFFTLLLARLHFDDVNSGGQGGSLLSAALILCNIKPEFVYSLRLAIRIFKKITEELAIYIFSYVIFYNAACSYLSDIDMTIISAIDSGSNKEEYQ